MAKTKEIEKACSAEIERRALRTLLDLLNAFYEDPENRKAYEEWAKSPEGKAYDAKCNA